MGYLLIAFTIALGVYGQLVMKWRVGKLDAFPADLSARVDYVTGFVFDPWVFSALAGAVIAAGFWIAALSRLELSQAYPFVSASFVLVLVASALFLGESITSAKVVGAVLIVLGLVIGSQG